MKSERLQLLYEQGTNEKLFGIVSFNQLFEQMLLISKGATTVKEATKALKEEWNLAKKDFDIFFYGKFPNWWHEYLIERWGGYVGETLDRDLLTMILEQNINEWDAVFCNETSFYHLLSGMDGMHQNKLMVEKCNAMIYALEKQIEDLERSNLIASTRLEVLSCVANGRNG